VCANIRPNLFASQFYPSARRLVELKSELEQYVFFDAKRLLVLVADDYDKGLNLVSLFLNSRAARDPQFTSRYGVIVGFVRSNHELAILYGNWM
jgi:hypothetical protein